MKTDVGTLVAVDMHRYLGAGLQFSPRGQFVAFHVRPNDVVGLADGQPLGKLARVIGIEFPARFFLAGTPDLDLDPVERVPVRIPNRSKDQRVRLRLRALATPRVHRGKQTRQTQD